MCDTTVHRLEEVWDGFVCAAGTDFLDCQPHLVGSVCTIIVIHCHFISIGPIVVYSLLVCGPRFSFSHLH